MKERLKTIRGSQLTNDWRYYLKVKNKTWKPYADKSDKPKFYLIYSEAISLGKEKAKASLLDTYLLQLERGMCGEIILEP